MAPDNSGSKEWLMACKSRNLIMLQCCYFFLRHFTQQFCRSASYNRIGREGMLYKTVGCHYTKLSQFHIGHDHAECSYPAVVTNFNRGLFHREYPLKLR